MGIYVGDKRYALFVGSTRRKVTVPLPYDAEIEYLESTGTQWIDIGIQGVTKSDEWTAVVSRVENTATTLFGYVQGTLYATLTMYHGSRGNVELAWGTTGNTITSSLPSLDEFHTYSMTSNGSVISLVIDGVTIQQTRNAINNTVNYGMGLFCRVNGGTPQLLSKIKLKSFQYSRSGSLIRDFIPVRKGQVGYMYDRVSGQLFGNSGIGDFVLGPDKGLPYDAEVEYLENNAPGGAYIDTGFKPNQNTAIDITVSIISNGIVSRFFETRFAAWNADYAIINFGQRDNQLQARFGTGGSGIKIRDKLLPDNVYKLSIRDYKFYIDDVFARNLPVGTFQCTANLCLFALNNNGTISAGTDQYSRIHACSIYDNGTLVRDFIPVRKGTTGYMYDKVSKQLFGNAGTGDFILGNDKN